jgi:energy-coupling factor transport system permease protein
VAAVRLFAATAFALLVGALRRGTRLAVAMDARGFDSGMPRSYARRQTFAKPDVLLVFGAAGLACLILGATIALGLFRPII